VELVERIVCCFLLERHWHLAGCFISRDTSEYNESVSYMSVTSSDQMTVKSVKTKVFSRLSKR